MPGLWPLGKGHNPSWGRLPLVLALALPGSNFDVSWGWSLLVPARECLGKTALWAQASLHLFGGPGACLRWTSARASRLGRGGSLRNAMPGQTVLAKVIGEWQIWTSQVGGEHNNRTMASAKITIPRENCHPSLPLQPYPRVSESNFSLCDPGTSPAAASALELRVSKLVAESFKIISWSSTALHFSQL